MSTNRYSFDMFRPWALIGPRFSRRLNAVSIQRESRITRDLTMPEKDWSQYDQVAKGRYVSERASRDDVPSNVTPILPALLRRQGS